MNEVFAIATAALFGLGLPMLLLLAIAAIGFAVKIPMAALGRLFPDLDFSQTPRV